MPSGRPRDAVRRWLVTHGERVGDLRPVFLGDDLFACRPVADARVAADGDCLPTAEPEERTTRQKVAGKSLTYRHRWFHRGPSRDGNDARIVDWLAVTITEAEGKVTDQSAFVTSLTVTRDTVAEIVACAEARWQIENESFDVLKSDGDHLEHNFGHGKRKRAMTVAALTMLAFAIHTVCDCLERISVEARTAKRARHRVFEHIRTITAYRVFPDRNTLIDSEPPPDIEPQIAR